MAETINLAPYPFAEDPLTRLELSGAVDTLESVALDLVDWDANAFATVGTSGNDPADIARLIDGGTLEDDRPWLAMEFVEGTTITAKAGPNALAVLAVAEEGNLLNAPDVYMDKIAVGPGYSPNIVNLDKSVAENVAAVAAEKGVPPHELIVCVLDRPRHEGGSAEMPGCGMRRLYCGPFWQIL